MLDFILNLDKSVFLFFNAQLSHPVLDFVMPRITNFSFWLIPGLIAAALFVKREKKQALIVLGLLALTIAIADQVSAGVLKKIFLRPRPCHPDFLAEGGRFLKGGVFVLEGTWRSLGSFPSSHSANTFAAAMLFFYFYRRRAVYFFAFASMIGYSRVYNGVHYPLDIIGGAVFGCLVGAGVYWGYKMISQKIAAVKSKS